MTSTAHAGARAGRLARPATVRVWDPLVRIFHWSLAVAFLVAWVSSEDVGALHRDAGYVIAWLVGLRVVWGVIGTRHARFADFLYRPSTVLGFLKDSLALGAPRHIGHNPAGGIMVILLLVLLAGVAGTGMMMTTDAFWGVEWVRVLHAVGANLLLLLVFFHLIGVAMASFEHRENLVTAMFTGRKRAPEPE